MAWQAPDDVVNFPNAKTTYEVIIEIFENVALMSSTKEISLTTELLTLDLSQYLNGVPPYTKIRVSLRPKTRWAISRKIATAVFHTTGTQASEPRNFRIFWSPMEKVIFLIS